MIKKIIKKIVLYNRERQIRKKAIIGNNIQFATSSGIMNTGKRENVVIGNHGCCFGILQALCNGKINIGNNIYIGSGTHIQSKEQVIIGDNVIISNDVLICDNNNHPTSPEERLLLSECENYMTNELWSWKYANSKPIVIEDNVWIGKNAVIMKGVTIGKGSIVGLGSIVTHNVPKYSVVVGNPATVVKRLEQGESNEKY